MALFGHSGLQAPQFERSSVIFMAHIPFSHAKRSAQFIDIGDALDKAKTQLNQGRAGVAMNAVVAQIGPSYNRKFALEAVSSPASLKFAAGAPRNGGTSISKETPIDSTSP